MKTIKYKFTFICLLLVGAVFQSCEEDEVISNELVARFTQTILPGSGTVDFINLSENATSYAWDFGDGTFSTVINPSKTYSESGTYEIVLSVTNDEGETQTFQDTLVIEIILLRNGDFENGSEGWIVGVNDNAPAPVVTVDGNSYYEVFVSNPNPSLPFLVNVSQKVEIIQGETYSLKFEAWSDNNRTLIAGIGLSGGDFSNDVETVNLTDTPQEFEVILSSENFGAPDARVLFDSNADGGFVRIDNVVLELQ